MIGSPDVLAFTGTKGFAGDDDDDYDRLPEEQSVPLLNRHHPWFSTAQFRRDFILVAEFSEQVGPTPVLTIPDDPKLIGAFDLNHFSVRIMSVDYQASGPGHNTSMAPGPRLNFSEDSEVILGDSGQDAFAYVHHLTLHDLEARGMVRPFCMAYVSSDQNKLMENFCELSAGLSRAAEILKTGNRQMFSVELQRKLQQLQLAQMSLQQGASPLTEEDSSQLEAVERSTSTHRELLRQVTSYPNRKLKQPDFLPYDPADSMTDTFWFPPLEETPPRTSRSEHHLKSLDELCNSYFLSLMRSQLVDMELCLRGDRVALHSARVTSGLSRKLPLTNFLFELWTPEDREEEEEMEEPSGVAVMDEDAHCSCVQELAIKLEPAATSELCPQMTGSLSSSDSIEVLGTERSYQTQQVDSSSRETPTPVTSARRRPAATEKVFSCTKRLNSEDSIEVLSTTGSICPDDMTAITEEDTEKTTVGALEEDSDAEETREKTRIIQGNCNRIQIVQPKDQQKTKVVQEDVEETEDVQEGTKIDQEVLTEVVHEPEKTKLDQVDLEVASLANNPESEEDVDPNRTENIEEEKTSFKRSHVWSVRGRALVPQPSSFQDAVQETSNPKSQHPWSLPHPPARLLSLDEASDCTGSDPSTSSGIGPSDRRRRRKSGLRALRFLKQHTFAQHALYCLLSGRALVVLGADQGRVRKLLDGLSLFLPSPGPGRAAIMADLSSPLQLSDLLTCRLFGVHRSASNCSPALLASLTQFSRYLALLDLDQKTLHCPSYSGSLVNRLANPWINVSRGATYLLHLESGLTALSNLALLYTSVCRHGDREDFLRRRGLSGSDANIMRFLSELITLRHTRRGPAVLRLSYTPVQLHKNTHPT